MERLLIDNSEEVDVNIWVDIFLKSQILIRSLMHKFELADIFELYGLKAVFNIRSDDYFDVVIGTKQILAL